MTWLSSSVPPIRSVAAVKARVSGRGEAVDAGADVGDEPVVPSPVATHRAPSGAMLMLPIDCVGSASAIGVQVVPLSHER